jgi:hypothetical protein
MRALLERVNSRIPDAAPKQVVLGLIAWLMAAALMPFAFLFAQLNWMRLYQWVFTAVFFLIVSFVGCVVWFLVEHASGRTTPWRQRDEP